MMLRNRIQGMQCGFLDNLAPGRTSPAGARLLRAGYPTHAERALRLVVRSGSCCQGIEV